MKDKSQLQTEFSRKIFNFLKSYLYDFYPGKEIKPETPKQKALKASFYHIIRKMAGDRPEFLIEFIQKTNPNTDKAITIPFDILEETLKKLILAFTTILFTKLNYSKIFASSATIPPYTNQNRIQLCINLARIYLYLSNNYQAIDYIKFAEDFQLRPKRFNIISKVSDYDKEKQYVIIKSDNKFNIYLDFNIPKTLFHQKLNIPSLANSLDHLKQWFKQFFSTYNRQFAQTLDETKVFNSLKYQI